ncbi:glutathione S-transferase N-terminal domain-containing protein [Candidatus Reidiella endopervernicosa]|uniref:Glutathione S-transferase N-terminal domain-containing protein n=1 Tax=Candidatus Reidiella endopervernicosa TaxID=2738883 RepID=A0A6N0HU39_9GAMM|nr:glutathione S-transferase N-terminal domain-containing protein [Candidatus Reidiella endopervernicosa]QKQ25918.1 glutathione S-transferase N-terminal domain-containing protein [Candidatus Reidiella endopervernicosa]
MKGILSALLNLVCRKVIERNPEAQAAIDAELKKLTLYHYPACPFCLRVRRVMRYLKLDIPLQDVMQSRDAHQALLKGGGMTQVPCLQIIEDDGAERWLYESADINHYLKSRFSK